MSCTVSWRNVISPCARLPAGQDAAPGTLPNVAGGCKPLTRSLAARLDYALGTEDVLAAYARRLQPEQPLLREPDRGPQRAGRLPAVRHRNALTCSARAVAGDPAVSCFFPVRAGWILDPPPGRLLDGGIQLALPVQA